MAPFRILLATLCFMLMPFSGAVASTPSVQDFVPSPDILSVELSPSGQKLLIVRKTAEDHYQVEIAKYG